MSNTLSRKIRFVVEQIKKGHIMVILKGFIGKIYSKNTLYGLKMDLTKELKKPRSFVKVSIRQNNKDDAKFFMGDNENISLIEQLPKCYVAITEKGEPCFRQWIIDSSQNKKIKEFWRNSFPQLKDDEALMESAFTVPKYRGLGVMPLAIYKIAKATKLEGKKKIISFVPTNNINSIKALYYAGFRPYSVQKECWFMFIKTVTNEPFTKEMEDQFDRLTKQRRKRK